MGFGSIMGASNARLKKFRPYCAVIDEKQKETLPEHETQLSSIRWHLSEGVHLPTFLNLDSLKFQLNVPVSFYFLDISNSALIL